ncbi:MAG: hypothetical protein HC829_07975 [Bacteroidales bacterium]|nr:hypothetical protein [Bacteroidales bacterium]
MPDEPRLAQWQGTKPVYPASVVKFVYLMAAYAFQEQGACGSTGRSTSSSAR